MNTTSLSGADEQASLWAARLEASSLSPSDRAELDAWLACDPAHRELLARYCDFSADIGHLLPALAASGAVDVPARARAPRRGRFAPAWALAAALAVAAVVAVVWAGRSGSRSETIATSPAQRRTFTLADGTQVELNANTSVEVEQGSAERRVRLANGEAFFVVSKDQARPFIVDTPAGSVRVTGTIFNVRTSESSVLDVTVVEGSVQVRPDAGAGGPSSGPVGLAAGDQLSARDGGVSLKALSAGAIDDALAWRQGRIVCVGMPLSELLARFGHYHRMRISATPGAASLNVGGRFGLDDIDGFYGDIRVALPVRVTHQPDGSVRVSLSTEP
jgi:transmembrane sensor